ncbi:MAG: serine O-acetyltransferase [bacterium]|nr:serine O-acetyltransferase [bacterium]
MSLLRNLREDLASAMTRDPAARNRIELLLLYPTIHAIWAYRIAHCLWNRRCCFVARFIMAIVRSGTGIEIHPAAVIGRRFFIDHGAGVVIGETAVIGDDVLLYQGVTLGGTNLDRGKRHPTLGNMVVVGAGAKVLGPIEIGSGARIGAGSVVIRPVSDKMIVAGIPARPVGMRGNTGINLRHDLIDDPNALSISGIEERLRFLENRLGVEADKMDPESGHMEAVQ